jgi:tRNA1(Val) A37 N6-methylase TrmN6
MRNEDHGTHALSDDAVAGSFRIFQRRGGHRYSLDDTLVAWVASRDRAEARRVLDLGCGIGSVLLMLAYKLPEAHLIGIEALDVSFRLAERNVARNGLAGRVRVAHGDLRDAGFVDRVRGGALFDLVTGTPPYLPLGSATPSPDPQRAHARMELRGGVEDYVRAAARTLAPRGRAVVCADARRRERVLASAREVGLVPVHRLDMVPREGARALFTVWSLAHRASVRPAPAVEERWLARDADGARTASAHEVRRHFDLPLPEDETPSPRTRPRAR